MTQPDPDKLRLRWVEQQSQDDAHTPKIPTTKAPHTRGLHS